MRRKEMYHGGICFITDRTYCDLPIHDMTAAVLEAGVTFIQYRDKQRTRRGICEEALRLRELTRSFGATLIINDHADIALAVDADGVHLGQDDLPLKEARRIMGRKIIGISTHDLQQARQAETGGADYIGFGPIFHTTTKDAGAPKGVDSIRLIKGGVKIPLVAIGGISPDNAGSLFEAGADAAAVATAICRGDIRENTKRFLSLLEDISRQRRSG
jgi:thiamine-phosphate pyrophosphorylase